MRITLQTAMSSALPAAIGLCATDTTRIAEAVNLAQERLIAVAGENGFWGGWVKTVFNISRDDPYLTLPPTIARIINLDVCHHPVQVQNQWYEFLFGNPMGLQDTRTAQQACGGMAVYDRGNFPTAYDLPETNQYLRAYYTDARDIGVNIFFAGAEDQNGNPIYEQNQNGAYLTLAAPFATTSFIVTSISGIQKAITWGDVEIYAVDATTGDETLLSRIGRDETSPEYRRYLITGLPTNCCCDPDDETMAQVTAMAKLEYIPARRATDFLLIQSIPALIAECQAIRMEGMDDTSAMTKAEVYHARAVKLLNQQLGHEMGKMNPAINFAPFGTARLQRQSIGTLV